MTASGCIGCCTWPPAARRADRPSGAQHQLASDPVGMGCLFLDQTIAFTAGAPGILFGHARDAHDPSSANPAGANESLKLMRRLSS